MRILIDESLPHGLKTLLEGLDVVTVPERGWRSMRNGELLEAYLPLAGRIRKAIETARPGAITKVAA